MLQYPALVELATQQAYPLGVSESFLVGRNETADICVFDTTCSRHHFRIVRRDGCYVVEPLNSLNPTYCNSLPIKQAERLTHGSVLQAGHTRFQFLLGPADETAPRQPTANPVPVGTSALSDHAEFLLADVTLIGRDEGNVQILLRHPQVSRRHAAIAIEGKSVILTDLGSANGTFRNGQRILGSVVLQAGDQLDIGPFGLQFTGTSLIPQSRTDNIELIARGLQRVVKNRETGEPLPLLDNIHLAIRPREFVCLLGPSGSGKSTLLSALSGRSMPDAGVVLVNGKPLHANFEAIKQDIAVVPQKDVLHESLAVEQALWYTAKLRLPADTSNDEIAESLKSMLDTVGLTERRGTKIRHLSGGQVKRASLANEILCKPSLLFLDEVTSGLDEQTDRDVMNLFRSLADAGKTVVCITHSLANVERTCHLVVILAAGGKLAFFGKPGEALEYFGIDRLGDVYDRLAEKPAEHWQASFLQSRFWRQYIAERMPATPVVIPPPVATRNQRAGDWIQRFVRQTLLTTQRYAAVWYSDYPSLLAMLVQSLVVAVLLGLLFGDLGKVTDERVLAERSVKLMFLLAISSYWFGCNNAAKEIVKERTIYTRERDFNLLVTSYYSSKILLLTFFSVMQTILLYGIVRWWCAPPGAFVGELAILLTLAMAGVSLGLAMSAFAATEEMAITMIPMAVIPQIILSGAISPLSGTSERLAEAFISTFWGKRGMDAGLPTSVANSIGLEQHSTVTAVLMLSVHAAIGIAMGLALLHWQNRRR